MGKSVHPMVALFAALLQLGVLFALSHGDEKDADDDAATEKE